MTRKAQLDVYKAKDGWRWRLYAPNGRIIAESGEAYVRHAGAVKGFGRVNDYVCWGDVDPVRRDP